MCLEERIKMLKEELNRHSENGVPLYKENEHVKSLYSMKTGKQMVSIEIQANEQDIRDAYEEKSTADVATNCAMNLAEETLKSDDVSSMPSLFCPENSSQNVLTVLKEKLLKRKRPRENFSNCVDRESHDESEDDNDLKIVCEEVCAS